MKSIKIIIIAMVASMVLSSCGTSLFTLKPQHQTVELSCSATPENRFNNLNYGIDITVTSDITNNVIYDASELDPKSQKFVQDLFTFEPQIKDFVKQSMTTYVRSSGIEVARDANSDYRLKVRVREFKIVDGKSNARCTVVLDYTLTNPDNEIILQQTARGRYLMSAGQNVGDCLDKAFSKALADMDWVGIANALKVHKRADQEQNRQVKGDGTTSLEHTIIRWYIVSSPAGADVSWRIVSSTPDVKNTNASYVGTTPYETTESFDIRGLKFENSGDVQIEITVEKPGYLPQRRRFNLRQAIEQREISAKFNLVKDE